MKTNKILAITLSLPLSFCSISCSNSQPKKIDMSSYSISEGSTKAQLYIIKSFVELVHLLSTVKDFLVSVLRLQIGHSQQ